MHALWREAHFQVKMQKTFQVPQSIFGGWDVEKVHSSVARSTFWSQHVQKASASEHFWKLRCWKSARCCGAKQISKWKWWKHHSFAPLFGSWDFKKVHAVVARSTFATQSFKNWGSWTTTFFEARMWFCVAGARDCAPCQKRAKRWFCSSFKNDGGRGTFECSSEMLGGRGADFLRAVAVWRIRSWGALTCFCVIVAALRMIWHQFFVAGAIL